jgi:hypothetical protein
LTPERRDPGANPLPQEASEPDIAGAGSHYEADDSASSVSGGSRNTAQGSDASITGGYLNTTFGNHASITGGEGFILQKLEGDGLAFVHAGGTVVQKGLGPGEQLKVDTGCIVGLDDSVDYDITRVKGIGSMLSGGDNR